MPYLNIATNVPMNRKKKVLIDQAVSKLITVVPKEKPEFLMSHFEDCVSMGAAGDFEKPCAMVELRVLTKVYEDNQPTFEQLLKPLSDIVSTVLEIEPIRVYVTITLTPEWGADGIHILKGILK